MLYEFTKLFGVIYYCFWHANYQAIMESSELWPEVIMRSFFTAGTSVATSEKLFFGSWNRLLNTMFPPDTSFEVVPQFPAVTACEAADFILLLLIYVNSTPVFVVEVKPPGNFPSFLKRQEADLQLRRHFLDISSDMKIPILHGVSAFGTKIAFYTYDSESRRLEPRSIASDPIVLVDTAPKEWWEYDILEQEGANKFREVVEAVKQMCANVAM